jgi:hypothetical protein
VRLGVPRRAAARWLAPILNYDRKG